MPIYRFTIREGQSNEEQRAQIAKESVRVHCGVTGAPRIFVNAMFSEVGPGGSEFGSGEIPEGKVAYLHATIRSGRDAAGKAEIVSDMTQSIARILGCTPEEVTVVTEDIPANWCMEGGIILPEPGSPEEAAWKDMDFADDT